MRNVVSHSSASIMPRQSQPATTPARADPSVVELGRTSRRPSAGATRPHITRLGSEHEAQLSALLCGLDRSARINRFGHPASDACVQSYAKDAVAGAAHMAGVLEGNRLIGVAEVFAARDGVAEAAFAIDAEWRRRGLASALLEAATRWAEQAGVATLRMVISRNNWPMRQFAHKAGAQLDLDLDEIFADIAVPNVRHRPKSLPKWRTNMPMQRRYCEFDAKDQKVYATWLRTTVALSALWGLALGVVVVLDVVNASMTPEQRIALLQQWVAFR